MRDVKHFIGGEFVDSADGATFESISPIDNTPIATVAESVTTPMTCFFSTFSGANISIVFPYALLIFCPSVPGTTATSERM